MVVIWTWVFVFILNLATTTSLAEICSSFPMAGGTLCMVVPGSVAHISDSGSLT